MKNRYGSNIYKLAKPVDYNKNKWSVVKKTIIYKMVGVKHSAYLQMQGNGVLLYTAVLCFN